MQYRQLGKTGLKISEIGFGSWGIGGGWGPKDDAAAIESLRKAFDLGVNFFDTALGYGNGHSESLIARAFKGERQSIVISSKVPPKTNHWPARPTDRLEDVFPAKWIIDSTEQTLRNLQTDCLDLQQLHVWADHFTHQPEWRDALEKLKKEGKIRAYGVSANDWDPYGAVNLVKEELVDSVQVIYNIFEQRPEEQLFPAALEHRVGILARVPFEEGLLSGALRPGHKFAPDDWRADWLTPERLEEAGRRADALKVYLAEDRPTLAILALKFILSHPAVSTTIPGMRTTAHVVSNVAASDGRLLDAATLKALKSHAFNHGWIYPWS